jgi:hypothetical protein
MSRICQKIEELRGTTNSLDLDEFTTAELMVLDEEIFECEQCGWWCSKDEESEHPLVCTECAEE